MQAEGTACVEPKSKKAVGQIEWLEIGWSGWNVEC